MAEHSGDQLRGHRAVPTVGVVGWRAVRPGEGKTVMPQHNGLGHVTLHIKDPDGIAPEFFSPASQG